MLYNDKEPNNSRTLKELQQREHICTYTHLKCLHPAGLFDLVVDDGSVLTDWLIPCSQTDGVLQKREPEKNMFHIELADSVFMCV